ncbi:GAF domain-containing sensor histidine kinase [Chlorogloea sp. CCALA 695]|uniref:GAF domain-containing sensor histidine kinase n=1 Tax=Chlorogloea sp. CCALA 695 TaxID=2107693 RepID=UPI000D050E2A|nr:GAF domain-containing sensor histidine kinase [Chlorogloea sp. CCALA 695]PSB35054.1 histidine kinase [Chlorogloea sp. CCALA 695]
MVEPGNRLVGRLVKSVSTIACREKQRLKALSEFGLLEAQTIPVFEEAIQTAAELLDAPICILGFVDRHCHLFKSAVGLSRLGLMNKIAQERQLPRAESFCNIVVESHQVLAINDTLLSPDYARKMLVQYGIRAYLGVPLIDAQGNCLGAISIMEQSPRTFTPKDIQSLEIIARWSMSEFERQWLSDRKSEPETLKKYPGNSSQPLYDQTLTKSILDKVKADKPQDSLATPAQQFCPGDFVTETLNVKLELLEQLIQELRTPLTSILGMATVLSREIYGPLMSKQKEYLEIIQKSGRYLLSLVNEISELGEITSKIEDLDLATVDIEMLCQQVTHSLEAGAKRKEQQIRLSIERDRTRTWVIDKEKVRQLLYHLLFSVIQSTSTGSNIRVHVFSSTDSRKIAVSVSHPWLGDGLTDMEPLFTKLPALNKSQLLQEEDAEVDGDQSNTNLLPPSEDEVAVPNDAYSSIDNDNSIEAEEIAQSNRQIFKQLYSLGELRLSLSCYLAQLHGGEISIELIPDSGYRYLLSLPNLEKLKNNS